MKLRVVLLLLSTIFLVNSLTHTLTCGGNCPLNKCTTCHCGTKTNIVNIATWCAKHTWNQKCCQCIAKQQSKGNANAQGKNTNGSNDVGLFQINSINWAGCNNGKPPCDLNANLKCAISVYKAAKNSWKPWSTAKLCKC